MSSGNGEGHNTPSVPVSMVPATASSELGVSPMTNLSVNLGAGLSIRKTLTFPYNEDSPKKCDATGRCNVIANGSVTSLAKCEKRFLRAD